MDCLLPRPQIARSTCPTSRGLSRYYLNRYFKLISGLTSAHSGVGVVALPTERVIPAANRDDKLEDGLDEEAVKILEAQATFDNFIVWGHENPPAADETFVKAAEEWIKLAEAV